MSPWRKSTPEEQRQRTLQVLETARDRVRAGATLREVLISGSVEGWWARQAVQRWLPVLSVVAWDRDEHRTRGERLRVLDLAIRAHGGRGPRRGGWQVSSGR